MQAKIRLRTARNAATQQILKLQNRRFLRRGREEKSEELKEIHTPNVKSIDELCEFLKIKETQCAKSRIYVYQEKPILILTLGNEEVNESKLEDILVVL